MKEFILPIAVQVLLLGIQGTSYILIQKFQGNYHDMMRPVDRHIPLVPHTVYIYAMWYPLLFLYPLYLFSLSRTVWLVYIIAIGLDVFVSLAIYVLYPTSFERPKPPETTLSGKILRILYVLDYKGLNCMPSMHCSQCFIILMSACFCGMSGVMPALPAIGISILAVMIVESTVLTKQHVIMDILAALPLGIICYAVAFAALN